MQPSGDDLQEEAAGLFRVWASVQCRAFGGLGIAVVLLGGGGAVVGSGRLSVPRLRQFCVLLLLRVDNF